MWNSLKHAGLEILPTLQPPESLLLLSNELARKSPAYTGCFAYRHYRAKGPVY